MHLSKFLANILEARLTIPFLGAVGSVYDERLDFTRRRRSTDNSFVLDTVVCKAREQDKELYVAFIDFQKPCYFVFRDAMIASFLIIMTYRVDRYHRTSVWCLAEYA